MVGYGYENSKIRLHALPVEAGKKTMTTIVQTLSGTEMGVIRWKGAIKAYVFVPRAEFFFDAESLKEITEFMLFENALKFDPPELPRDAVESVR